MLLRDKSIGYLNFDIVSNFDIRIYYFETIIITFLF